MSRTNFSPLISIITILLFTSCINPYTQSARVDDSGWKIAAGATAYRVGTCELYDTTDNKWKADTSNRYLSESLDGYPILFVSRTIFKSFEFSFGLSPLITNIAATGSLKKSFIYSGNNDGLNVAAFTTGALVSNDYFNQWSYSLGMATSYYKQYSLATIEYVSNISFLQNGDSYLNNSGPEFGTKTKTMIGLGGGLFATKGRFSLTVGVTYSPLISYDYPDKIVYEQRQLLRREVDILPFSFNSYVSYDL